MHGLNMVRSILTSVPAKNLARKMPSPLPKQMFQTDDVEAHFVVRGNRSLRPETPDPVRYEAAMAERRTRLAVR